MLKAFTFSINNRQVKKGRDENVTQRLPTQLETDPPLLSFSGVTYFPL